MNIHFTKKIPKDTFYSLTPINWLLRGNGLSNIHRKQSQLTDCGSIVKSVIYVLIFGLINCVCMYYKVPSFIGNSETGLFKFADCLQLIYWISYLEYIIDIYFVYKYGRGFLLKYIKALDYIDAILGSPDYDKIRKTIIHSVTISIAVFLFNFVFDYSIWAQLEGWISASIYAVDYLYFFLNMLTVLDIISHIIQVQFRLQIIGNLMQSYNTMDLVQTVNVDTINNVSANDNRKKSLESLKILCYAKYLETDWFNKCYLQLLEQVSFINSSYGFRILMYCINALINMINLLNMAIRIMNGTLGIGNSQNFCTLNKDPIICIPSISSITRALNYAFILEILMYRCEETYKQSDRILETVDVLLISKKYNTAMKNTLLEFRNLLITRPIQFHAAKFFTMNYTLLVSITSVVMVYTIIMLQNIQ